MGEAASREKEKLALILEGLRHLASELQKYGLRSLILTGSWAKGSQLATSDVDVIIIAEGFEGLPFYEREYLVQKYWARPEPLDPWCYTPREAWQGVFEKPRLDLVDALEYGLIVYDDGFWASLRREYYRQGPYKRVEAGGYWYLKIKED